MDIFPFWNVYRTVRKKDFLFLARVRVSSQYFPVLDFISYSCAIMRSWLSLLLGLAVGIFQFWNVYRTVRKKDFVFLARVRVSIQYFLVSDCISYSCARKRSLLSLWLGLAVDIFQFWNVYRTVRGHIHTDLSCTVCIAHIYVHTLLAAAKQHYVEYDHRQLCTLLQMTVGCHWVPSHLAL